MGPRAGRTSATGLDYNVSSSAARATQSQGVRGIGDDTDDLWNSRQAHMGESYVGS